MLIPVAVDVSVIICTFNRATLLNRCLESLAKQTVGKAIKWEVIVVNNNCSDHTPEICDCYVSKLPLRIINEPRQGKTYALNTALAEAKGALLLFTDDDVRLHPSWVDHMLHASAQHPSHGWFGGRVIVDWSAKAPRPHWLNAEREQQLRGFFVSHNHGSVQKPYQASDLLPLGANLAVRAEVFSQVGAFRTDLGPRGEQRGVDDETEWLRRASAAGVHGIYVPEAICWHHMDPKRLTLCAYFNYGVAKAQNAQKHQPHHRLGPGHLLTLVMLVLKTSHQALKRNPANLRLCLIRLGYESALIRGDDVRLSPAASSAHAG